MASIRYLVTLKRRCAYPAVGDHDHLHRRALVLLDEWLVLHQTLDVRNNDGDLREDRQELLRLVPVDGVAGGEDVRVFWQLEAWLDADGAAAGEDVRAERGEELRRGLATVSRYLMQLSMNACRFEG